MFHFKVWFYLRVVFGKQNKIKFSSNFILLRLGFLLISLPHLQLRYMQVMEVLHPLHMQWLCIEQENQPVESVSFPKSESQKASMRTMTMVWQRPKVLAVAFHSSLHGLCVVFVYIMCVGTQVHKIFQSFVHTFKLQIDR